MASKWSTAVKKLRSQRVLPSNLTSAELSRIRVSIRRRAFFAARVENAKLLDRMKRIVTGVVDRGEPGANAIGKLRQAVEASGYRAVPGTEGTIRDLTSSHRLKLIAETNAGMARGYGEWAKKQDIDKLRRYPCQQLVRKLPRVEPRDWPARWRTMGGAMVQGDMIAGVNNPIWARISRFGLPYPPFDFNSGMGLRMIPAKEAEKRKVRFSSLDMSPRRVPNFDDDAEGELPRDPDIRDALLRDLGPDFYVRGGKVKKYAFAD